VEKVKNKLMIVILVIVIFTFVSSSSLAINQISINTTIRIDGDSFCVGRFGENSNNTFANRVAKTKNLTIDNESVGGYALNDVLSKIYETINVPSQAKYNLINVGFNDIRLNGAKPYISNDVVNKVNNIISYLRLGTITDDSSNLLAYSGSWITQSQSGKLFYKNTFKYTNTQNSKLQYNFYGDKVSIGTFVLEKAGGIIQVAVDGVTKYTLNTTNQAAVDYASSSIELSGLGKANHVLTLTKIDSGTGNIYIDWIGIPSETPPTIIFNGITNMKTSMYTQYAPYNNSSDALTKKCNDAIRESLANFDEKVIFIDQSDYDPNSYNLLCPDDVHPNNFGHEWIASNILKRVGEQ